jgi:hypothetical protein
METQSTLIRSDGTIELYTVTDIDLYLTFVVNPGHSESNDTLGIYNALDNLGFLKLGVLVVDVLNRLQHLANGLQELYLTWMFTFQILHNFLNFHSKSI